MPITKQQKRYFVTFCLIPLVLVALGCARTVTQIVTYGSTMVVEVTLAGTMETTANRYFMVVGTNTNYKIPLPPPTNIVYEFIEPGDKPQQGSIADYYTNYYSTWAGYVIAEPAGYFLAAGPFVQSQPLTREAIGNLADNNNKIKFNFQLNKVFGSTIPDTIYFDLVSVSWPANDQKFSRDHLTSTNSYISKIVGSTISIDDDINDVLDPALNIVKCTVTIQ